MTFPNLGEEAVVLLAAKKASEDVENDTAEQTLSRTDRVLWSLFGILAVVMVCATVYFNGL